MADLGVETVAETARLILRRERPGDLETWLEHMNTPEVMGRIGGVRTDDEVAASFAKMAEGELPYLFVALKSYGTLIGKCGLSRIAEEPSPAAIKGQVQAGWGLRADYWGQGYAREAAEAILAMAFEHFGCAIVFGQTSESNTPSWRLMQRLGMHRRAEFDYTDPDYPPEDNPTMIWALDRAAWELARA